MPSIRLILADNDQVFRHRLRQICEMEGGFKVIGEAADGEQAVRLAESLKPDVILMDINMPKLNGIQVTREILIINPAARILILTMDANNQSAIEAINAGAKGYLFKNADTAELLEMVRWVHQNRLDDPMQSHMNKASEFRRLGMDFLGESSPFLDILLDITSEAIIYLNEAEEIILFSAGAEAVFGYTQADVIGQPVNILLPEEIHQLHAEHIKGFISSGVATHWMNERRGITGKRRNGEIFTAEASITQFKVLESLFLAVVLHDISEQRQLEDRLRKLSVVVEQTPASIVITDTTGKIEYVNPAFERVTGFSSEEAIGKTPSILKSGLMPIEMYQSMWGKISAGEIWYGEICNKKKNGELFWELGTVSPIHDKNGVITNFISIKEDITERKKTEEELNLYRQRLEELVEERTRELRVEIDEHKRTEVMLREKEQSLDLALRIGQLGSWEYDYQTGIISWADEVYRIFGLIPGKLRLTYEIVMGMVHPDDLAVVQSAMDQAIASCKPFNLDHKIVLKDGQERAINLTAVPIFDKPGVTTKMVGTVQDITERVRIKSELLEKERMSNELAIAHSIQIGMLPRRSPSVDGWQFAGYYRAATEVGGDTYDWIELPNGEIGMLIADTSDKGVGAALFMALSRAIIRTNALECDDPVAAIVRSNEILFRDYSNEQFVTVIYASLDPADGHIEIVNAGHNYPLLYSSKDRQVQTIKTHGTVLGLFPEPPLDPVSIDIMPGDVLVFYTDGLTEATNFQEDYYDEKRVIEMINTNAQRSADEILNAIVQSWQDFIGELPQMDDLTLIVVKRSNL